MREAKIILPEKRNDGASLLNLHETLRERLCDAFGGFTMAYGEGGWRNPSGLLFRERILIYTIACEDSLQSCHTLLALARWARAEAKQEAIYLRQPSGEVQLVED